MPLLKVSLGIGISNAKQKDVIEIDEAEWEACSSPEEKEELVDKYATEWAWEYIDIGAQIVEDK